MAKKKTLSQSGPPEPKRVFIVEDHPVFREGLAHLLTGENDLEPCGFAGDAFAALREITRLKPDLVLVDISLPGKSGLELIKELRASDKKMKLLVVSMHDEAVYANRVLRLGADGYIMKKEDPAEIVQAIRDVLAGHIYVSESVLLSCGRSSAEPEAPARSRPLSQLTDSQLEILELLGEGKTDEEIAGQMHSSAPQIQTECQEIRKRLNIRNENALIRYAVCWVETGRIVEP